MKKLVCAVAAVAFLLVVVAGLTAAIKSYQFTGTVKSVEGNTFTVEKSAKETWTFESAPDMKAAPKVGEKVTVHYKMVATDIESKGAATEPKAKTTPKKK